MIARRLPSTEERKKDDMRILVTGGAGFIGSHLCRRLIAEGHEVVCLDNLSSGSMDNIEDLVGNPRFSFVRKDVTELLDLPIDRIFHLACPASPVHYQKDPVHTGKTNVLGALNVLELARKNRARVLFTSTSEVYGDPLVHPQREDYWGNVNPIGIRSCYDEGKRMAETLFFDFHRKYGVDIRVVRIFNTYGPGMQMDDGRVVSNFIVQALRGEDLVCYGNGQQTKPLLRQRYAGSADAHDGRRKRHRPGQRGKPEREDRSGDRPHHPAEDRFSLRDRFRAEAGG